MRPRCAKSRSAPGRAAATSRPNASPGDIARRPRRPRTAGSRAMCARAVVIERARLRLRHRRIERIRRTVRAARGIVRPRWRIRAATTSWPRAVVSQVLVPVLLALFISRQRATKTIAATRAERDAIRGQYQIGFVLRRRRRCYKPIARHTQRPRIRRIERTTLHGRSVLHAATVHACRMPIITSSSTPLRTKHIGPGRPIGQRIATGSIGSGNRKRTRKRGGGRQAKRMIHQRSQSGDVH